MTSAITSIGIAAPSRQVYRCELAQRIFAVNRAAQERLKLVVRHYESPELRRGLKEKVAVWIMEFPCIYGQSIDDRSILDDSLFTLKESEHTLEVGCLEDCVVVEDLEGRVQGLGLFVDSFKYVLHLATAPSNLNIYVNQGKRISNVCTLIMREAMGQCLSLGGEQIQASSLASSVGFYKKLGFIDIALLFGQLSLAEMERLHAV